MNRQQLLGELVAALGDSKLVWFGTRGEDAESATELPQFAAAFSIIGAYERRASVEAQALEDLVGVRVDLDTFELDDGLATTAVDQLRQTLLRYLSRPTTVFTYRPSTFLSAVCFARQDLCTYLGMFKDHQAAFEHKPWVESEVRRMGLPHIPWSYIADHQQLDTLKYLEDGAVVLRRSRSSGGTGVFFLDSAEQLRAAWPSEPEAYVSVAPFIENGLPVNIGGVVWHNGVTIHPASLQLIGISELTTRRFGYCGNDFGAIEDLSSDELERIGASTLRVGDWLRRHGYRGTFGVDYLLKDGQPLFTEINPRFQGSTHLSSQISAEAGESCILLEHIAACLGFDAPKSLSMTQLTEMGRGLAHFVAHNTDESRPIDPAPMVDSIMTGQGALRCDVRTKPSLVTDQGGAVARVTVRSRLTRTGFELVDPWRDEIQRAVGLL